MADSSYTPKVYREQGGDRQVVASGGSLDVESGAEIDIESGGALKIAGTALTGTAAELNKLAGVTAGTVTASKAVVVGAKKDVDHLQFGSVATSAAILHGAGISGTPETTATADKNFQGYWTESTATSGDSRGVYVRHYFSGAGGSGEALRAYGTVNNVTAATGGTVNGAHISLSLTGASAAISGSANAARVTLDFAGTVGAVGGTVAVLRADTNIAAGPTIPARTAFIAVDNLSTQKLDYLLNVTNPSTTMFAAAGTGANSAGLAGGGIAAKVLKVVVDGTDYWLPLFSSNSN